LVQILTNTDSCFVNFCTWNATTRKGVIAGGGLLAEKGIKEIGSGVGAVMTTVGGKSLGKTAEKGIGAVGSGVREVSNFVGGGVAGSAQILGEVAGVGIGAGIGLARAGIGGLLGISSSSGCVKYMIRNAINGNYMHADSNGRMSCTRGSPDEGAMVSK
jgi:hypothetical protein